MHLAVAGAFVAVLLPRCGGRGCPCSADGSEFVGGRPLPSVMRGAGRAEGDT